MTRDILGRMAALAVLCATCAFIGGCATAPDSKAALSEMTTELVSSLPAGLDADAALAVLGQAIADSPDNAMCWSNRATVFRDAKQDYPHALADYNQAVALAPGFSQLYVNRGRLYELTGDPALAREDYSKAIDLSPKNTIAFCRRGDLDRANHHDDSGIADYTAAVSLDPRCAAAFFGRGMIYVRLGRYDLALEDLSKVIELKPHDYAAYRERGLVYLDGKTDPAQALADINRAIKADPDQPLAHADKARICEFLGRPGEALAEYRKVIKLASSAPPETVENARKRIAVLEDMTR